jgi:DNA primase
MRAENVDYVDAVKILADRAGISIPEQQADERAVAHPFDFLLNLKRNPLLSY